MYIPIGSTTLNSLRLSSPKSLYTPPVDANPNLPLNCLFSIVFKILHVPFKFTLRVSTGLLSAVGI